MSDYETQQDINQIRRGVGKVDARKALENVVRDLTENSVSFQFTQISEEEPTWIIRAPASDVEQQEPWLRNNKAYLIHICQPAKAWECIEGANRPNASRYFGYTDLFGDGVCYNCKRQIPDSILKIAQTNVKLHDFRKETKG